MDLYHGTDKKLNAGDLLLPKTNWINGKEEVEKSKAVYATPDLESAEYFGARGLYSRGKNMTDNSDGGVLRVISSDRRSDPFIFAKDRKYYVYRVKSDGFVLSNPDKRDKVMEHRSESPAEILEVVREETLEEWLNRGNRIYIVSDSIMEDAWAHKKSFDETLKHAVPYRDWPGGVSFRDLKIKGRD
ncbi:MAG: hypothetical protein LBL21_04550 [Rickettsiales bacterium]|jgi:hypothetical protein|nr:hypothetical protein [Rickettsiales bacterium]